MKVAVVTPTIGSETLEKCVKSVANQSYDNIVHYIFVDGLEHDNKVKEITKNYDVSTVLLEENVGKGWYGHRVYSACSFLVNADAICYLDEDNWFDPDHVQKLVEKLEQGNDWAYSLRKIYDKEGNFLCEDNCESLGKWPVYFNPAVFHIDTSSFIIRRDVATRIGHAWYGQWGADRQFFNNIKHHHPKFACTNSHTLCYRLDGNPNSVTKEFFDQGNEKMTERYGDNFPWKRTNKSETQIGPNISIIE